MGNRGSPKATTPSSVEVEWQLDAADLRPVAQWLAETPPDARVRLEGRPLEVVARPSRRLVDTYLDTSDGRLRRAGLSLRVRRKGARQEATIKDFQPADPAGLRRRLEVTERLGSGGIDQLAADGPVGRRVAALCGSRPLVAILEIRTRRQPYAVRVGNDEVGEVALDETTLAPPSGAPARLLRVEVEVDPGWAERLRPFLERLQDATALRPASLSKLEAGLLAAGTSPPGPPDLGSPKAGLAASTAELAYAVLRRNLATLMAHEPGTRLGDDPEDLHDMRVATRRLRAGFDLFEGALPTGSRALASDIRWMGGILGQVRDIDVQSVYLEGLATSLEAPHRPPGPPDGGASRSPGETSAASRSRIGSDPRAELDRALGARRGAAHRELLAALDSERWEGALAGLVDLVRQGRPRPAPWARLPAVHAVPEMVVSRHRAALKAARRARRSGSAADYHRLRVRAKSLRYAVELTADLYGRPVGRYVRSLARIQDVLGALHDAQVAVGLLEGFAAEALPAFSPATLFAMGQMVERTRQEIDTLTGQAAAQVSDLDGPAWRELARTMEGRARKFDEANKDRPLATSRPRPGRKGRAGQVGPVGPAKRTGRAGRADLPLGPQASRTELPSA